MAAAEYEERECRICRGEDEPGHPLFHPCRCSGSIKYTHEDCLVNWLAQSGSTRCELCNHPFRFEPLYQPNTPRALPTHEFVTGIFTLAKKALRTAARILLVFSVWLFLLPVGTCWIWYALFINSLSHLPKLLASRGPGGVMADAFYGFLLSAGIVFIFLGVSSLREYIRHFPPDHPDNEQHHHMLDDEHGEHDDLDDDEFTDDDEHHHHEDDEELHRQLRNARNAAEINAQRPDPPPLLNDIHPNPADGGPPMQPQLPPTPPPIPPPPLPPTPPAGHHEVDRLAHRIRGLALLPPPHNENDDDDDERLDEHVLNEVDNLLRDTIDELAGAEGSDAELEGDDHMLDDYESEEEENAMGEGDGLPREALEDAGLEEDDDEYEEDGEYDDEDDDDDDIILDDDEEAEEQREDEDDERLNVLNRIANLDRNDERVAEGGAFFGLFDLDPDEVPLEEVVGLRGPIRNLFDNAGTVLVSNAVFLCFFTLVPLLFGRLTLRLFSMHAFPTRLASAFPSDTALPWDVSALWNSAVSNKSLTNTTAESAAAAINRSQTIAGSTPLFNLHALSSMLLSAPLLNSLAPPMSTAPADQPVVSYVDNLLIVLLGYGMVALLAVGYIGVMSMLRRRFPLLDSPLTKQVARMLRYIATFVKIVVLIAFEFGVFPLACGWWLDLCTLDIFGASLQARLAYCRDAPWTCSGLHWILGIFYMVHISLFISLLRDVVRPQLLWFLRNPDDPEFHPFRELVEKPLARHARRMCLSVVIYVPLIVAFVYVPAQLCLKVLPSVFPFRSEDFSHILIDVPFGNLLVGPLIRLLYYGRPEISVQRIVSAWVRGVAHLLGIEDAVVKRDNGNGNNNNIMNNGRDDELHLLHDEDEDNGVHPDHDPDHDHNENHHHEVEVDEAARRWVRMRGALMLVLAWLTLVVAESALVAFPTLVGRSLMSALGLAVRHDLHPFLLGLNAVLLGLSSAVRLGRYVATLGGTGTLLTAGAPYVVMAVKGSAIVGVWLGVIPLATGLLFELVVMPLRVAHNETPYFCAHQDWALGLLLLKVWACVALTGGLGPRWRDRVMRAREADVLAARGAFTRTMAEVVLPVLTAVVTALAVPYAVARGLVPALGAPPALSNVLYRYGYLTVSVAYCASEAVRHAHAALSDLHDSIRDDKYLIGKRLYNFMDASSSSGAPSAL